MYVFAASESALCVGVDARARKQVAFEKCSKWSFFRILFWSWANPCYSSPVLRPVATTCSNDQTVDAGKRPALRQQLHGHTLHLRLHDGRPIFFWVLVLVGAYQPGTVLAGLRLAHHHQASPSGASFLPYYLCYSLLSLCTVLWQ